MTSTDSALDHTPGETTADAAEEPARDPEAGRISRIARHPAVVAAAVWLVVSPVAAMLPGWVDVNPFAQKHADLPLAIGGVFLAAGAALAIWRRSAVVAGVAMGLFAAYLVLVMRTALHGTPFGFEGVNGDSQRVQAMITRYTVSWRSAEGIVDGVASEYPPLFPYVVGKLSVLLDVPAWRLFAPAQVVTLSGALIVSFAMWLRVVKAPVALALSSSILLVVINPTKAYEILAIAIFVPWILQTVGKPDRGRMPWLAAGLVGGLMFLTYYAYFVYTALGIIALIVWNHRTAEDRRGYLLYLARVAGVMAVVTSWFVIPLIWTTLHGTGPLGDTWDTGAISQSPLPFLEMTVIGIVQLVGLAGLVAYLRSAWWAGPLLMLLLGAYAYRAIGMLRWVGTGHTGLLYYTTPLIEMVLVTAAILTAAHTVPLLAGRMSVKVPREAAVVALSVLLVFTGFSCWRHWMPTNGWVQNSEGPSRPIMRNLPWTNKLAAQAHAQAFPDGGRPRYAETARLAEKNRMVPVGPIANAVDRVQGKDALPLTLSYDERIYAFHPWPGYVGMFRASASGGSRFDERYGEMTRISQITDPASFARESGRTKFGSVDVFILEKADGELRARAFQVPFDQRLRFTPQQFDPAQFELVNNLPGNTFLAIRKRT